MKGRITSAKRVSRSGPNSDIGDRGARGRPWAILQLGTASAASIRFRTIQGCPKDWITA
jgi:hypothetical protein